MKRFLLAAGLSLLFVACAGSPESAPGTLAVKTSSAAVQGSYSLGDSTVKFSSTETAPGVFDVVVDLHGVTLSALVDRNHQVAEADGFAQGGSETQLVEADRQALRSFVAALSEQLDADSDGPAAMLARLASNWSQMPDTVPLQRQVAASENRGWTSLCSYYGSYVTATHDDNNYGKNNPRSTSYGHVGLRSSATEYYVSGRWITTTQDHVAGLYERGSCYGNCGPGCPSSTQTLTLDCHNHDQCVRNGHALASLYCDDEFTSASDDEFFAPRCSGT
jgi:hypothetical protein